MFSYPVHPSSYCLSLLVSSYRFNNYGSHNHADYDSIFRVTVTLTKTLTAI